MAKKTIEQYLTEFATAANDWFKNTPAVEKHYSFFELFFEKKNLESLTWEQVQAMGNHLHAANALGIAKGNAFGRPNHDIQHYKKVFLFLKFGQGTPEDRVKEIADNPEYKIKYFGDSMWSELFGYVFPENFTFKNSRSDFAVEELGIAYSKAKSSKWIESFLSYNKSLENIREQYKSVVGKRTRFPLNIELDQFFSWLYETQGSEKVETLDVQYWTIAAGEGASQWSDWQKNSHVTIGWDSLGDITNFKSRDELTSIFKTIYKKEKVENPYNDTLACWEFANALKPNDVVFVKDGRKTILGMGIVVGEYKFDESRNEHKHTRKVEWKQIGAWEIESRTAMKTLTNISDWPDFVNMLLKTVSGENPDLTASERNFWWLNANPEMWNPLEWKNGDYQSYSTYNEKGTKRRIYKHFVEAKVGDWVIAYLTSPYQQLVCLFEVTKGIYTENGKELIQFKKLYDLPNAVDAEVLRSHPDLQNCEPLKNNQGSLFKITPAEFEIMQEFWEQESNPQITEALKPYTFDDLSKDIFVSDDKLKDLLNLLERKKNLILQGPPGTGKTFLAKRLAYALMGKADKTAVELIQFHQSYSYEDFIQGLRPNKDGKFTLKNGIFYRFCVDAMKNPNKKFFFVIDEINRGNLSKIFGELMLLIESDKRGKEFAIPLTYSEATEEKFYIPENVYIIGTMNTADRSLSVVDYALRRRFSFFDLKPEFESKKFQQHLSSLEVDKKLIQEITQKLSQLNQEIGSDKKNLGTGFTIGHSFFCHPTNDHSDWYKSVIENEIVALLREYWFDDEEKVNQEMLKLVA